MRATLLALVLCSLAAKPIYVPQYRVRNFKNGDQKITVINVVPVPLVFAPPVDRGPADKRVDQKDFDIAKAEAVTLTIRSWVSPKQFIDEKERLWTLIGGDIWDDEAPAKVKGWILRTNDGRPFLYTAGGRMYVRCRQPHVVGRNVERGLERLSEAIEGAVKDLDKDKGKEKVKKE